MANNANGRQIFSLFPVSDVLRCKNTLRSGQIDPGMKVRDTETLNGQRQHHPAPTHSLVNEVAEAQAGPLLIRHRPRLAVPGQNLEHVNNPSGPTRNTRLPCGRKKKKVPRLHFSASDIALHQFAVCTFMARWVATDSGARVVSRFVYSNSSSVSGFFLPPVHHVESELLGV